MKTHTFFVKTYEFHFWQPHFRRMEKMLKKSIFFGPLNLLGLPGVPKTFTLWVYFSFDLSHFLGNVVLGLHINDMKWQFEISINFWDMNVFYVAEIRPPPSRDWGRTADLFYITQFHDFYHYPILLFVVSDDYFSLSISANQSCPLYLYLWLTFVLMKRNWVHWRKVLPWA